MAALTDPHSRFLLVEPIQGQKLPSGIVYHLEERFASHDKFVEARLVETAAVSDEAYCLLSSLGRASEGNTWMQSQDADCFSSKF